MTNDLHRLPIHAPEITRPNRRAGNRRLRELPRTVVAAMGEGADRLDVVRRAALLADTTGAGLSILVHGRKGSSFEARERRRKAAAQAEFWRERAGDLPPTRAETIGGRLATSIAAWLERLHPAAQVLVVDRRDVLRPGIGPEPLVQLLARGDVPMLALGARTPKTYRRVLLALDASDASARAVRTARALGLLDGAQVSIVHAFFAHAKSKLAYVGAGRSRIARHMIETSKAAARDLAEFLNREGISDPDWDVMLEEGGDAASATLAAIGRVRPDLVVVGTQARGAALRFLQGSTARAIVHGAACDVLVVPHGRRTGVWTPGSARVAEALAPFNHEVAERRSSGSAAH